MRRSIHTHRSQWIELCYLCGNHVTLTIISPEEQHYDCMNTACAAHYNVQVWRPSKERKKGVFSSQITASALALRSVVQLVSLEENPVLCPLCKAHLRILGGEERMVVLVYSNEKECDVALEVHVPKNQPPLPLGEIVLIVRVPEPAFSNILREQQAEWGYYS